MKTIILNMVFDDENKPDIGSIKFDRYRENLHLLGEDISKLNSVLTRAVCIGTYNADKFYYQSGDDAHTTRLPLQGQRDALFLHDA